LTQVDLIILNNGYDFFDLETKKRSEVSTVPDDITINTIDEKQNDVLRIPMPSVLKRGSLFHNETDPDAIKIDVFGDDKLCGSLIFSSEDLQMLVSRHVPRPELSVSVFFALCFLFDGAKLLKTQR
jgi:hypothetical protein